MGNFKAKGRIKLTQREVAELACKVIAINTIYDSLWKMIIYLYEAFATLLFTPESHPLNLMRQLVPSGRYLVLLLLGIILWLLSENIARK